MIGRSLAIAVLVALVAGVVNAQTPLSFRDRALAAETRNDTAAALAALNQGLSQVVGVEPHGDAVDRVTWYIEQLKSR